MTRRLEAGPLLVTLGALLLLASLFLDWWEGGITAWQAFEVWDVVLFAIALAAIVAGLGVATSDGVTTIDRRWLPAAAAVATVVVASQIIDTPPAVSGIDPDAGAWLALGAALLMCIGAVLTFSRVRVAFDVERRDPRRKVQAVDARGPEDQPTGSQPAVAPSESPPWSSAPAWTPRDPDAPSFGRSEEPPGERLFTRDRRPDLFDFSPAPRGAGAPGDSPVGSRAADSADGPEPPDPVRAEDEPAGDEPQDAKQE